MVKFLALVTEYSCHMKKIEAPLVEVIVLTYNHEQYIEECLASIFCQKSEYSFRVTVHDDKSTDKTPLILGRLKKKYGAELNLILQSENQLSKGVNITAKLLLSSTSEFVAFCEGDDHWVGQTKLQKQVDFLNSNPWCSLVHSGVEILAPDSQSDHVRALNQDLETNLSRRTERVPGSELAKTGNFIFTCTAMFRRNSLRDEVLRLSDGIRPTDLLIFALASEKGDIGYIDEIFGAYRIHESNSWAGLPVAERQKKFINLLWFLSGVLTPPLNQEFREVLARQLLEIPEVDGNEVMLGVQQELRELHATRDSFDQLQRKSEAQEVENSSLKQELYEIRRSLTYKLGAPIRTVGKLILRVRNFGKS